MVNDKSLTVVAELLDENGYINWKSCGGYGSVSAVRADDLTPVPISTIAFDSHGGPPPADSMRFYNGVGSVSLVLDNAGAEPAGEIIVSVSFESLTGSRRVTVLSNPLLRNLSGQLTGADLVWGPADGVIHLTGECSVAAGQTLQIAAGTLIMVDAGPQDAGTRVNIAGGFEATGDSDRPIFFFPTAGAPALHLEELCTDPVSNPYAWRGVLHTGSAPANYNYVFITGAGNGALTGHTRPPVIKIEGSGPATFKRCFFADNNGKAINGVGSGYYKLLDSLVTRCGHGTEWSGNGDYTLLVEGSWYTGIGHAPEPCGRDGDCMNIRGTDPNNGGPKVVRGCIMVDGNDDGVDQAATDFTVENCIIGYLRDTAIILDSLLIGGSVTVNNVLTFGSGKFGIAGRNQPVYATNCTFGDGSRTEPIHDCTSSIFSRCILEYAYFTTCCGTVEYCSVLPVSDYSCGVGNGPFSPTFVAPWPGGCDYTLQPGSPALTAGPGGTPIGWQGFAPPRRGAKLFGVVSETEVPPAGVFSIDVFVEDATEVAGFSTQIETQRLSGTGSLDLACPTCITIDHIRPDRLFLGVIGSESTVPADLRATSELADGSASTGPSPRYLATYQLAISPDATVGSVFQISIRGFGSSSLSDEAGAPIAFIADDALTVTAAICPSASAGIDQHYCTAPASVAVAGDVADATGSLWTTSGDGSFADDSAAATTYALGPTDLTGDSVVLTLTASPGFSCTTGAADSLTIDWIGIGDGDMDANSLIDGQDIQLFAAAIGAIPVNCHADLTGDNTVDAADVVVFVSHLLGE